MVEEASDKEGVKGGGGGGGDGRLIIPNVCGVSWTSLKEGGGLAGGGVYAHAKFFKLRFSSCFSSSNHQ